MQISKKQNIVLDKSAENPYGTAASPGMGGVSQKFKKTYPQERRAAYGGST